MSTVSPELERVIRDALRSDQIAESDLIHRALRDPRPRTRRRFAAVVAAAAAVAVIAVLIAVLVADRGNRTQPPAGDDPLAGVVGYRWQVTHVVDPLGSVDMPSSLTADVGFTGNGYVLGDDTVNSLQAKYTPATGGYEVRGTVTSAVGSVGLDPIQKRTIAAVDALFLVTDSDSSGAASLIVQVTLADTGVLTLEHGGFQVTLTRAGPQPDLSAQPTSPTATVGTK